MVVCGSVVVVVVVVNLRLRVSGILSSLVVLVGLGLVGVGLLLVVVGKRCFEWLSPLLSICRVFFLVFCCWFW